MRPGASDREALLAFLEFQIAAGIDIALDEAPHDRFAEEAAVAAARPGTPEASSVPPPSRAAPSDPAGSIAAASRPVATLPTAEIAADARTRAAEMHTLQDLEALVGSFDGCTLKASARQLVFGDGVPGSRVMFLGEAPGADEDRAGRPFVGQAGQLLDLMLGAIGLDRSQVYIANVVPWRPPGNRTPTPQEVAICLPFTLRQIELAAPAILVTLGKAATQTLLGGPEDGIFRTRGRWFERDAGAARLRILPMLHPAYLLRQPLHKRLAWRDLRLLRRALDEPDRTEPPPAMVN